MLHMSKFCRDGAIFNNIMKYTCKKQNLRACASCRWADRAVIVLATILGPAPGPAYTRTVQWQARLQQAMQKIASSSNGCICAYMLALSDGLMPTNVNPRFKD